jgi:hypothetical protein
MRALVSVSVKCSYIARITYLHISCHLFRLELYRSLRFTSVGAIVHAD